MKSNIVIYDNIYTVDKKKPGLLHLQSLTVSSSMWAMKRV